MSSQLEKDLREYMAPDDDYEDRGTIRELMVAGADRIRELEDALYEARNEKSYVGGQEGIKADGFKGKILCSTVDGDGGSGISLSLENGEFLEGVAFTILGAHQLREWLNIVVPGSPASGGADGLGDLRCSKCGRYHYEGRVECSVPDTAAEPK